MEKQAYTISEFVTAFGLGRSKVYLEIKAGRLATFHVGKRTLIHKDSAKEWIDRCRRGSK